MGLLPGLKLTGLMTTNTPEKHSGGSRVSQEEADCKVFIRKITKRRGNAKARLPGGPPRSKQSNDDSIILANPPQNFRGFKRMPEFTDGQIVVLIVLFLVFAYIGYRKQQRKK